MDSDGWKAIYNEIHGYSANYDGWWYPNGTHIPGPNQFGGKFLFDLNKDPNEEVIDFCYYCYIYPKQIS